MLFTLLKKLSARSFLVLSFSLFLSDFLYAADNYFIRPPGLNAALKNATLSAIAKVNVFPSLSKKNIKGQWYYFVSFSMADSLIKEYLQEAAANEGILVLRGVSPGMSLHDFLIQKLSPFLQDKQNPQAAYASFEINPHLFTDYHITQVPTLVYSLT